MAQNNAAYFSQAVHTLRSGVSRYAVYGMAIAVVAVLFATVATVWLSGEPITPDNLYRAHYSNASLLVLDIMPFLFAFWGQYVGLMVSHQAGAMIMDETERLRIDKSVSEAQALRASQCDPLTGLGNRAYFLSELQQRMASAHLSRTRIGILVIDLDGFSEVNEQFGEANGDSVLKSVARRVGLAARESDLIARLDGDRFALLLDGPAAQTAVERLAWRITQELGPACALHDLNLNIAASIGGAIYPDHADDVPALLAAAEDAMQGAKGRGSGFEMVTAKRALRDADMHSLSAELRHAIADDQLVLYFQPLVQSSSGDVHGVEALVRWQHPRRGLIMPGDVIPRAERGGLMRDLSNWVLRNALAEAARLHASGWPLQISVNLSARSLLDPDFPDVLAGLLAVYELPSRFLILEITEDTLMADQRRTLDIITRVVNMGVQISIDDFGTGYSQLAYLKQLPASEIKIDRSFIQDMLVSRTDLSIVQATIGLAHALNLRAVGEGVETEAQADRLLLLGCDLAQGFYFGRPMPVAALREWLVKWPQQNLARRDHRIAEPAASQRLN